MRSSKDLAERWLIKPLERSRGAELRLIGFSIIDDGNAELPKPNSACGARRFAVRVSVEFDYERRNSVSDVDWVDDYAYR
jgi:hypothetical protein